GGARIGSQRLADQRDPLAQILEQPPDSLRLLDRKRPLAWHPPAETDAAAVQCAEQHPQVIDGVGVLREDQRAITTWGVLARRRIVGGRQANRGLPEQPGQQVRCAAVELEAALQPADRLVAARDRSDKLGHGLTYPSVEAL